MASSSRQSEANAPKRRRILGADGNEISTRGLAKPQLDDKQNKDCWLLVHHLHAAFYIRFQFDTNLEGPDNLDTLTGLTSLIWMLYLKTKQEANKVGRAGEKIPTIGLLTLNKVTLPISHLLTIFNDICKLYGLEFLSKETTPQLRGNFQSNLTLFYAFKFRCQEGLYVNNTYRRSEAEREGDSTPVEYWGVKRTHWPLMYGGNFLPSMRSSLLQQMGPATILVSLAEQTDERFQEKWRKAAITQLSGVPNIETAVQYIQGKLLLPTSWI